MRVLEFPSIYKVKKIGKCFRAYRKTGNKTLIRPDDNVKWKGKRFKPQALSYHLNISRSHPPERITMICGHEWCIHPLHMYTGTAPFRKVRDFFDTFGVLPPALPPKIKVD